MLFAYGELQSLIAYKANEDVILRLKHPLGKLLIGPPEKTINMLKEEIERKKPTKLIAVGDIVSLNLIKNNIRADCIIIDFKNRRQSIEPINLNNFKIINVKNPASSITIEACEAIKIAYQKSRTVAIIVDGEEDLLTLPAIVFAPYKAFIIYGQPYVGIVLVTVTKKVKLEIELLLKKMAKFA